MAIKEHRQEEFMLKKVWGIPPPRYLFILLVATIVLGIMGGIFGLFRYQYHYTVVSTPSFSTVHIDEMHGVTPFTVRLRAGTYQVTVSRAQHEPLTRALTVNRNVADIFRRAPRVIKFAPAAIASVESVGTQYQEIHRWSLTGVDQLEYRKPPVISTTVESLLMSHGADVAREILELAARDVSGEVLLADWTRALGLLHSHPNPFMAQELVGTLHMASDILYHNPRVLLMIEEILANADGRRATNEGTEGTINRTEHLTHSQWRDTLGTRYSAAVARAGINNNTDTAEDNGVVPFAERISIAGTTMIRIPQGAAVIQDGQVERNNIDAATRPLADARIVRIHSDIYVSEYEITIAEFQVFLDANPQWSTQNRPQLIADGLADDEYLNSFIDDGRSTLPVSAISWHAAYAYCQWLSAQLPEALADYQIRLPTEREWMYVAHLSNADQQAILFIDSIHDNAHATFYDDNQSQQNAHMYPQHLLGSVWEWTGNPFHVSDHYFEEEPHYSFSDLAGVYPLKGGSAVNSANTVRTLTRAALFSSGTSQYVGFRPILAKRK